MTYEEAVAVAININKVLGSTASKPLIQPLIMIPKQRDPFARCRLVSAINTMMEGAGEESIASLKPETIDILARHGIVLDDEEIDMFNDAIKGVSNAQE